MSIAKVSLAVPRPVPSSRTRKAPCMNAGNEPMLGAAVVMYETQASRSRTDRTFPPPCCSC